MNTVAYIRTSTDEQVISLDVQRVKIDAMAAMRDLTIDEVIVDQESAKSLNRAGMTRLLAMVDAGQVSCVLIAKLDRLTRSVRDLSDLMDRFSKHNVTLVSVGELIDTATAGGRMVLNLLTTVAQWERECISERVTAAMRHQKAIGKRYCAVTPFGYRRDGDKLVTEDTEQAIIRKIFAWHHAGVSLLGIARRLNGANVPTKTGGRWHDSTVRSILKNRLHGQAAQAVATSTVLAEVLSALENLGMPRSQALGSIADVDPTLTFDEALRRALQARSVPA